MTLSVVYIYILPIALCGHRTLKLLMNRVQQIDFLIHVELLVLQYIVEYIELLGLSVNTRN